MTATRLDLIIEQGTDFEQPFLVTDSGGNPRNISAALIAMQIRADYNNPLPLITLSTQDGSIAVDGPAGSISLPGLDAATTTALQPGDYVYDMKMALNGVTSRLFQGTATISPEVTTIVFSPVAQANTIAEEDGATPITEEDGITPITEENE